MSTIPKIEKNTPKNCLSCGNSSSYIYCPIFNEYFANNQDFDETGELDGCSKFVPKQNSNWPDSVRLKMIEESELYQEPRIYQYGYYDGYQLATDGREELEKENERLRDGIKWACDNPRSVFVFNELQKLIQ